MKQRRCLRSLIFKGGYTLVELIVVISIIGILAGVAALLILWPVRQYAMSGQREVLVTEAESALRRMARDIRTALPNSVRVTDSGNGTSFALELLPVLDGGKYNVKVNQACNKLKADNVQYEFDILGTFRDPATVSTPDIRLVINNQGIAGADVYVAAGASVGTQALITPGDLTLVFNPLIDPTTNQCPGRATCSNVPGHDHICMVEGHKFGSDSPNQRLYVVKTPVSYLCDTATGTIARYYNYAIPAGQPTTPADFVANNASSALLVRHVSSCQVRSSASDVRDRGLVTLYLGLTQDEQTVKLVHQAMLDNSR